MKSCLEAFREYISELRRLMRRARAADTGERRAASPAGDPAASRAPAPRQEGATSDTGVLVRKDHVFDTETEAVVSNAEHPAAQQFPAQGPFPEVAPAQYLPAQGPFPEGPPAQYFPSQQPFTRGPPFQRPPAQYFPAQGPFPKGPPAQYFPLSILSLRALLFSVLQLSTFPTKVLFLRALLLRFKSASLSLLAMSSLVCSRFLSASCGLRSSTRSASRGKSVMEDVCSRGKRLRARTMFYFTLVTDVFCVSHANIQHIPSIYTRC